MSALTFAMKLLPAISNTDFRTLRRKKAASEFGGSALQKHKMPSVPLEHKLEPALIDWLRQFEGSRVGLFRSETLAVFARASSFSSPSTIGGGHPP